MLSIPEGGGGGGARAFHLLSEPAGQAKSPSQPFLVSSGAFRDDTKNGCEGD